MARTLTKKQRGFVKDYLQTGNGEAAARNNYEVANDNTARAIASENLTKPNIVKAISEVLTDDLLSEKHLALLNKVDEEGEIDVQAVSKGLEMAYKIKGTYAPEKSITLKLTQKPTERVKQIADELKKIQRRGNSSSN